MRGRFAPQILGVGLAALAAAMLAFALLALVLREPFLGFVAAAAVAAAVGSPLLAFGRATADPTRREALIGVLLLWAVIPLVGALPFALDGGFGAVDAVFESMSGFTTTGATVLTDFEAFGRALFLWRGFTQWVGGVGIIVIFIAVFPQLAIAGRQLFFTEMPGPTEHRLTPRLRSTANAVLLVYLVLTVLCAVGYALTGMSAYEALAHTFTTVASGGFSPEARSMEAFSASSQWVACLFMAFSGANFALLFRALVGRPLALVRDAEFRAYLTIAALAAAALALLLAGTYAGEDRLRHGTFQALSILTTTGYASVDFGGWSERAQSILVILMFVGGSAGSTAGGVKVVRWLIVAKHTSREVRRALHPRAVLPLRVGHRVIPEEVLRAVAAFVTLYVGLFAFSTVVLVLLGSDFVTALSAAIAAVGNVGPGLGEVGPMSSYAGLHPLAKLLLTFDMYAGRLEVVTVFVLFTRGWWWLPRRRVLT